MRLSASLLWDFFNYKQARVTKNRENEVLGGIDSNVIIMFTEIIKRENIILLGNL